MTVAHDVQCTDGRICLRPCLPTDADMIHTAVRESITELVRWVPWCPPDYSMAHCRPWLETRAEAWTRGDEFDFVVLDEIDGAFLGGCALNDINRTHNFANLGYWIRTSCSGQGVATAAARLIAKFGFEQLGFTRIEIVAAVANTASQRVAERIGATREGIQRNRHVVNGTIYDAVMYSLIPTDVLTCKGGQ